MMRLCSRRHARGDAGIDGCHHRAAQTTPAAAKAPDDTPSVRLGATLFLDYTVTTEPKITDADGNTVT